MSCAVQAYPAIKGGGVFVLWIRLLDIGQEQRRDGAQNVQKAWLLHP